MARPLPHRPRRPASHRQRGVYALEWAIIFPVFFMLLYACISYGLAFLVSQSMQLAAEDAARAALRYQSNRPARLQAAVTAAQQHLQWLPANLRPQPAAINVQVCRLQDRTVCPPGLSCGISMAERCMVKVSIEVAYRANPILPPLPGLGVVMDFPEWMRVQASIMVDKGGI